MTEENNLLSDEKLAVYVRTKNQSAFKEIINRYQNKLMRYICYILQDEQEALDVVQEVFIKVYINLNGFDSKRKFSAWIYRIAHNEAMNQIAKRRNHLSLDQNEWILEEQPSEENLEELFDKKQIITLIRLCLDKLPLIYRVPLALCYLEEKSYEQISEVLRLPLGTVSTRINRAKKIMKLIYQEKNTYE